MTGAAAIVTPVKRKRTLKAAPREESRIKKGAATAGTGQKNQIEAVKEGTADNANLSRKKPPDSTQKMKKTPSASRVNDPRIFEEENVDDSKLGDMGDSDDEGAKADIHNEGVSLREVLESSNEPIGDDADNIDDLKGEEFSPAEENGVVKRKRTLKAAPREENRIKKGAAIAGTGQKNQMEAVKEGTADNANLSRKKPPESTQKMKKTPSASRVNDPRIFEEENVDDLELGDMGDSDDEGAKADIHNEGVALREVLESSNEPIGDDADNIDDLKGEEFSPAEGNGVMQLVGAPDGWVTPGPSPTWAGYQPKGNAPQLGDVDKPGNWSLYLFCSKYKTGSVYSGHFTPAGAMVIPANEHGEWELNGWRFHYQGWTPDAFDKSTYVRGEATQQDLKPDSRKGSLDANILRKHGCDADRVTERRPSLLLPTPVPIVPTGELRN